MEKFVVKYYNEEAHPSIKGNGFDGLVVGDYREEAERFIAFVNKLITEQEIAESKAPTTEQRDEIICPTCKVPRDHIAYSKLENKYKCIYCNTTWAAN
jgi:hypothetical protein